VAARIDHPGRLFLHQLRTQLWVEETLADDVLPTFYERVHATDLRSALERHLRETETHVKSVRRVFDLVAARAETQPSPALLGLRAEYDELLSRVDVEQQELVDLVHVDTIARGEHHEISAYGALVHAAQALQLDEEAVHLLRETLEQEQFALEQIEIVRVKLLAEKVESAF
jgi:ferritin-like metal-binding protein YciE